ALTCATALRVVRSVPVNPSATSHSWTTSARTLPLERSTHSSIFGRYPSIIFGRRPGPVTGTPASRAATYRRTVFASTPARTAAECALPVASNASRISMISLSDFIHASLRWVPARGGRRPRANPGGTRNSGPTRHQPHGHRQGDQLSVSREVRVRLQGD